MDMSWRKGRRERAARPRGPSGALTHGPRLPSRPVCGAGAKALRRLNTVTGVVITLLVLDGRAQVNQGTAGFAALPPSDPFLAVLTEKLADPEAVGRASTNTTAAFTVGLIVGLVYLATAFVKKPKEA